MELKDFIKETLIQIVQGISEAQEALADTDCAINPSETRSGSYTTAFIKNKSRIVQDVDFNIALTSSSNSENKTGIGVMLGSIGLGGNHTSTDGNISNTNISFSVPVVFPSVDNNNKPISRPIAIVPTRTHHY